MLEDDDVVIIHSYLGDESLSFSGWLKANHNIDINTLSFKDHVKYRKLWTKTSRYTG